MHKRTFTMTWTLGIAAILASHCVLAQYPSRPVEMIVPIAPGVQVGPGVLRLAGAGAQANGHWRQDPAGRHFQARRHVRQTLLIHGARSVLAHAKEPGPWLEQIKARRHANVVIVAQAAKMARAIWAVTTKEQSYQKGFQSVRPNAVVAA